MEVEPEHAGIPPSDLTIELRLGQRSMYTQNMGSGKRETTRVPLST